MGRQRAIGGIVLGLSLWATPAASGAAAREEACRLTPPVAGAKDDVADLIAVWSSDTSLLLSDGERLVPDGIALPSRLHPFPEVTEAAARAAGPVLAGGSLRLGPARADRHGRRAGRAVLVRAGGADAGEDLAVALLRAGAGAARWEGADPCAGALLAAEEDARRAGRGIWALPTATARAGDVPDVAARVGLFSVIEGEVRAAGRTRDRIFLNFGARWKDDFTVVLDARESAAILGDGLDPAMLRGTLVRVRGVVRADGGPAVFPRHPLALTVVGRSGAGHRGVNPFGGGADGGGAVQVGKQAEGEAK